MEASLAHADEFVRIFGSPDVDDSTENDNPRPPIPTRILWYKRQRVKVIALPEGTKLGDAPPYVWCVIEFTEPQTRQPIPCWPNGNNLAVRPIAVSRDGSRLYFNQAVEQPEDSNLIQILRGWTRE